MPVADRRYRRGNTLSLHILLGWLARWSIVELPCELALAQLPIDVFTHHVEYGLAEGTHGLCLPSGASEGYTDLRFCASRVTLATA